MVLSDVRQSIRSRLDDSQYDQATIDEAINFVQFSIFNEHAIRFMETTDDVYVSAGDTSADLPDDIQTLLNVHLTSPQVYNLLTHYMEYGDFMKAYPGYATYTASQIYTWTDFAGAMRFAAPASTDAVISVDYMRVPALLINDSDVLDIPDNYKEMVVLGGLARCMERNEDYAEASSERNNYAQLLTGFIAAEGRGQLKAGPTIIRSNRRGRGSWSARDF